MTKRRLTLPSALLAVALLGGCGGSAAKTATAPAASAPAVSAPAVSAPAAGAVAGSSASAVAGSADATCPTSNTTAFAKTKFVTHAGLGFGAFHRYLYKPFRAGAFAAGHKGRVLAFVKAGGSALFIKREIRLASEDVKANPALCKAIAAPLAGLGNTVTGALDKLKSGDASGMTAAQTAVGAIEAKASGAGNPITEATNAPAG